MRTDDRVLNVIESGVSPISLSFTEAVRFDAKPPVLRSSLNINSLALGVLTYSQYRYVVERNKRGAELFARHTEKIFDWLSEAHPRVEAVTLPVFTKTLLSGAASRILFDSFSKNPQLNAQSIMLEAPADILFEDKEKLRTCLDEISSLGVRLAVSDAGDEFCPLMRLCEIGAKCVFADSYAVKDLMSDRGDAGGLPALLHSGGTEVFAPFLEDEARIKAAKEAGYDGHLVRSEVSVGG